MGRKFLSPQSVQITEATSVSYSVGTMEMCAEGKVVGHAADHSVPSSAEVEKEQLYTSAPQHVFVACAGTNLPLP